MTTELVADGLWTWFHDPRAVWADDKLFVGFNATTGIWVARFDQSGQMTESFRLRDTGRIDDHDVASVGVRPDGRLLVAYCEHNDDFMRVRISDNAFSVASFGPEITIAPLNTIITYPNLWYLSGESRWYLFYRDRGNGEGPPAFTTSDDDGETWAAPQFLMTDNGERPYTRMDSNGVDRIDISITDGHPGEVTGNENSIYHLYYDGTWRTSDGTSLGLPPFAHADLTQVWDGAVANSWNWDTFTGDNPRIVFVTYSPADGTGEHNYRHAYWNGTQWVITSVTSAGSSIFEDQANMLGSPGIYFDHENPNVLVLSHEVAAQTFEIGRWTTEDNGVTWSGEEITSGTEYPVKNFRPIMARGQGPYRLIWCRGTYQHFEGPLDVGLFVDLETVTPPPEEPDGIPQVAQAVIRNRLSWLSCNLSDGALIEELPDLEGDEVSRVIGEYTSASLSLPIPSMDVPNTIPADERLAAQALLAAKTTEPRRTMIVCVVNDVPTYAGIPLPRDLGTDAGVPLGLVSLEGYLRHRFIGDHTYNEQDVALIADGILRDAGDTDDGQGIGLIIDAPNTGVIASREYLDIDDQSVYDGLSELMDAGLIEWTIDVDWRDGFKYRIVDKIARVRSRLGRSGAPQTIFQSATFSSQGGSSASYLLKEDYSGDRYANVVRLRGAGEGVDQPRSAPAIDQAQLDSGVPVWELRDSAPQTVTQQALLNLHAERRLDRVRSGAQTLEVVARWDAPGARYGVDWSMGDDVGHALKGHAHPGGLNGARRAIGFALSIKRGTIRPILQEDF